MTLAVEYLNVPVRCRLTGRQLAAVVGFALAMLVARPAPAPSLEQPAVCTRPAGGLTLETVLHLEPKE